MSQQMDWEAYSSLARSDVRREVAEALQGRAKTPKEVEAATSVRWAHVSRALKQLREHGVAELTVEETTKKGRLHVLTEDGRRALELLQERDA